MRKGVLSRHTFMRKIIFARLVSLCNIRDEDILKNIDSFINIFDKMVKIKDIGPRLYDIDSFTDDYEKRVIDTMIKLLFDEELLPLDFLEEDVDRDKLKKILECIIYANRVHIYSTVIASSRHIYDIPAIKPIRTPLYNNGCKFIIDCALLYCNTHEPFGLTGIGPKTYKKITDFFEFNFDEIWKDDLKEQKEESVD